MVAPEIVIAERLELFAHGNDAGARGVDGESRDLVARNASGGGGFARGLGECVHVVIVALGGVIGIVFLSMEGIFGESGAETSSLGVDDSDADAEGAEIYASYNGHEIITRRGRTCSSRDNAWWLRGSLARRWRNLRRRGA